MHYLQQRLELFTNEYIYFWLYNTSLLCPFCLTVLLQRNLNKSSYYLISYKTIQEVRNITSCFPKLSFIIRQKQLLSACDLLSPVSLNRLVCRLSCPNTCSRAHLNPATDRAIKVATYNKI